jgi:class 3 adenylate cyclase
METLADDIGLVMDAAGSDRAVIVTSCECTPIGLYFAATHPERTSGLVLIDPLVSYGPTEETPWMWSIDDVEELAEEVRQRFPIPEWVEGVGEAEGAWLRRLAYCVVGPGALLAEFRRFLATDVRSVLPLVQMPTLLIGGSDFQGRNSDPRNSEYIAERIGGSRLVLLPGGDHGMAGWQHWYERRDGILDEIGAFVHGLRDEESSFDRVLATVLFTDIVESTETAARIGDAGWRDLVERHHAIVRSLLARYRGTEVDTAGDGFFVTFDGPARAIRCAQAIVRAMRPLAIQVRAGVHTGECAMADGKVAGIAVSIGARVGALALPSEVLVSQTVKDLVAGSGLAFEDTGEHQLKGVPDRWHIYRAVAAPA